MCCIWRTDRLDVRIFWRSTKSDDYVSRNYLYVHEVYLTVSFLMRNNIKVRTNTHKKGITRLLNVFFKALISRSGTNQRGLDEAAAKSSLCSILLAFLCGRSLNSSIVKSIITDGRLLVKEILKRSLAIGK